MYIVLHRQVNWYKYLHICMMYTHKYVLYNEIAYGEYIMLYGTSLMQLHNYDASNHIIIGKYKLSGLL